MPKMTKTACRTGDGPRKPFPDPTQKQRAAALDHVRYEIDQLMASDQHGCGEAIERALLESCLVHVRTLLDFFEARERKVDRYGRELDDVIPGDFGFDWAPIPRSDDLRRAINKHLSRLRYERCKGRSPPEWKFARDFKPVLTRAQEFIEHLRPRLSRYGRAQDEKKWAALLDRVKARVAYD
jgi:hypothetical protein